MYCNQKNIVAGYFILTIILQITTILSIINESYSVSMAILIITTAFLSTLPLMLNVNQRREVTFVPETNITILGYELKEACETKKENHK